MSKVFKNSVLPDDSVVVVSGANGWIGSHIVDEALGAGLKVRGTVRNPEKSAWTQKYFDEKYGSGRYEMVVIPDMAAAGAFDDVVKGASGFIHTATDMTFDKDPNKMIPGVLEGIKNALKSAATEPGLKRFVYTSSSVAAVTPLPDTEFTVGVDTWNDEAVKIAWTPPFDKPENQWLTYSASKTQAEQEAWKFVKENKPGFVLNTILPNANWGTFLDPSQHYGATAGMLTSLFHGSKDWMTSIDPQYFVDVTDCARVHVAAVLDPSVENERLFAFAEPYNCTKVLRVLRKLYPDRTFPDDIPGEKQDLCKVPNQRPGDLLRAWGQDGWTSLEESIKRQTAPLAAAPAS